MDCPWRSRGHCPAFRWSFACERLPGWECLPLGLALLASPQQDSPPSYPGSLRPVDVESARLESLEELAALADNRIVENRLLAATARVGHKALVPILFSRVDIDRQCGLFYNADTRRYYCLPPNARKEAISKRVSNHCSFPEPHGADR